MSKHTPGDWKVHKPAKFDKFQIEDRLIASGTQHIAEVFQYRDDDNNGEDGIALANARLIAAAPRLLEALKAVMNLGDIYNGSWKVLASVDCVELVQARAAISDAEGEA